jgi:hypothetical protein
MLSQAKAHSFSIQIRIRNIEFCLHKGRLSILLEASLNLGVFVVISVPKYYLEIIMR